MPLGPGGLDSNGIWLYGEDDSEALASDLLNLGMQSVSDALGEGFGKILQVVSTTKTDTFSASVTAGATTSVTGLTATITPQSTSSKIYAVVSTNALNLSAGTSGAHVILTRGGTPVGGGDSAGSRTPVNVFGGQSHLSGTDGTGTNQTFNYLDSPSTTSSVTYGVDLLNVSGTTCTLLLNRTIADSDNVYIGRASSTITLMEVAG